MRTVLAVGVVAAGALGFMLEAGAAERVLTIRDNSFNYETEFSCTRINYAFVQRDCTYGRTQVTPIPDPPPNPATEAWTGPVRQGGYYARGSAGDSIAYNSNDANELTTRILEPDAIKIRPPVTGTVTIDDGGTPNDGTDDSIAMEFSLGAAVRNAQTGQFTRVAQGWDSFDHTLASYNFDAATLNAEGGFDYVMGSRGLAPVRLCSVNDPTDCYPTNSYTRVINPYDASTPPPFWIATPIASPSIERADNLTDKDPLGANVGASTTASFQGYSCAGNNQVQNDCNLGTLVWGALEDPGFDNVVGTIRTNAQGAIIEGFLYWTQEYFIGAFGAPPGDNSWQGSAIEFTAADDTALEVNDDTATAVGDAAKTINVLANDRNVDAGATVTISVAPDQGGSAVLNGDNTVTYTRLAGFVGTETFTYEVDSLGVVDSGVVTVSAQNQALPVGVAGSIAGIATVGVAPASITSGAASTVDISALPGFSAGNTPATVSVTTQPTQGTTSVTGTTVRFVPGATFFAGTDTFVYTVTDANDDTATGTITVTIADVSPTIADATVTTEEDEGAPPITLSFTPGNGSVAQHTIAVTSNGSLGSCVIAGTTLTYTPNADSFGNDTCTVTITDGDGDTDTGTVSITVTEVEDNLLLPGGGGALDLWTLSLLAGLPLLRRRRRDD